MDILLRITREDFESVGTDNETDKVKALLKLVKRECPSIGEFPHKFWSGMEARKQKVEGVMSDADYPFISSLFRECEKFREKRRGEHDEQMTLVSFMISSIFARFCKEKAYVFLSSDKPTEEAGLTISTNFYEAELPVLLRLGLPIFVSRSVERIWTPFQEIREDSFDCPVWKRYWDPSDGPETEKSFVKQKMSPNEWDEWRLAPPRKPLSWKEQRERMNCIAKG
ncbi:hypothetical protein A9K97_gp406 [Tokyovirus A1]|uniref:hypothetical protein n=1 Tax=Tokyovirus A1 TaxID=1826170 RepID=UPI0007A98486|nr:hypothetical protein A9K97_gp406 [Tokyovirus A1]BAU79945.1 hypothetical protein [Tokyovirus A1]